MAGNKTYLTSILAGWLLQNWMRGEKKSSNGAVVSKIKGRRKKSHWWGKGKMSRSGDVIRENEVRDGCLLPRKHISPGKLLADASGPRASDPRRGWWGSF